VGVERQIAASWSAQSDVQGNYIYNDDIALFICLLGVEESVDK